MKVYKVVKRLNDKTWGSSTLHTWQKYFLKYRKNKITKAKIGKIFVFKTLKSAVIYAGIGFANDVAVGETSKIKRLPMVARFPEDHTIKSYWEQKLAWVTESPSGTYGCDSFRFIKIVKTNN